MYPRIILFILFPLFGFSQAPQKINFQSILRNANGEVVANKNVKLKISIQSGSMMDTTVYSETHLKTTDASGLLSLKIGTGTVIMGRFDSIKWGKASHFIKLEADFNGGNNFILLGTQELMSVPYAFHSNTADSLVGGYNYQFQNITNELFNLRYELERVIDSLRYELESLRIRDLSTQGFINTLDNQIPLVDIDGNTYKKIIIGSQIWMKENLRVSRYRNGDQIPIITDNINWSSSTLGARCWYNNDSISNEIPYGNLYNWYAVEDNRGLCPIGWHIPTDQEFTILKDYLGGISNVEGGKLKATDTFYWNSPNIGATNEIGFTAYPSGYRNQPGYFYEIGRATIFWASSMINNTFAGRVLYSYSNSMLRHFTTNKEFGASVRCLRD